LYNTPTMSKKKISPFQQFLDVILKFREERDWKQFHTPKDMAISLNLEAAELLEHFQWKNEKEVKAYLKKHKNEIADELIDILSWILLLSNDLNIDIVEAFYRKKQKDAQKYPVEKVKGKHKKYNEYR
jgi:dCTP diphosphatase